MVVLPAYNAEKTLERTCAEIPRVIPAMVALLRSGMHDVVLGSRILVRGALQGGMPLYKYVGNRVLTMFENLVIGRKLSEYHTGDRAFRRVVLCRAIYHGYSIGEISSPCRYFPEASSIGPLSSLLYAAGVIRTSLQFRLNRRGWLRSRLFERAAPIRT